jgi:hypothetical protein
MDKQLMDNCDVLLNQEAKICSLLSLINGRLKETMDEVDGINERWVRKRGLLE